LILAEEGTGRFLLDCRSVCKREFSVIIASDATSVFSARGAITSCDLQQRQVWPGRNCKFLVRFTATQFHCTALALFVALSSLARATATAAARDSGPGTATKRCMQPGWAVGPRRSQAGYCKPFAMDECGSSHDIRNTCTRSTPTRSRKMVQNRGRKRKWTARRYSFKQETCPLN